MKQFTFLTLLLILFASKFATAESLTFSYKSYKEAKSAENFISFEMSSTKFGIITTSFTSYVKEFSADYEPHQNGFKNVQVKLKPTDIDTDINARNEKMNEVCFESSKYQEIIVKIPVLPTGDQTVDATLELRGESFPVKVETHVTKDQKNDLVRGNATLSLKELKIPDPSIAIAKVKDEVKVKFQITKTTLQKQ